MQASRAARLEAWFARRTAALESPAAARHAMWLVPLLCGALSVLLGQDIGWDLRNYHLYNPFALLHDRIGWDLAPGQWQSYFNPTLDLPYYLLVSTLPGPAAAFIMGALHGLNFLLLLAIGRALLPGRGKVPLLLALCGLTSVGFLSELGNSMGDNLTALAVLAALWLVLRHWDRLAGPVARALPVVLGAGFVMGLGTGLKLTNATYAVGLCVALLAVPVAAWQRLWFAFLFGLGVLAGMAITAGWWLAKMWNTFGNPLFPQFNSIFKSPLAQPFGVIDTEHLPRNAWEALAWPLVFTVRFERVSEVFLRQLIWPVVYLLCVALLVRIARRRAGLPGGPQRLVVVFFVVSFLVWMKLFSIHRYLIPIELLAPLVAWLLFHALLPAPRAGRAAGWALALCAIVVFPFRTWGHAGWAEPAFGAHVPPIAQPAQTVIVIPQGDPPNGWMVPHFPRAIRFVSLGGGFPETPAWVDRALAALDERAGPHYVLIPAAMHPEQGKLEQRVRQARSMGLTSGPIGCWLLGRLTASVRLRVQVAPPERTPADRHCTLELQPAYVAQAREDNAANDARAVATMARYGLPVRMEGCVAFGAWAGDATLPYKLCPLGPRAAGKR